MYSLASILCILLAGTFLLTKTDLFQPGILTSGIWLFGILLFILLPNELPPLQQQFLLCTGMWCVGFVLSALMMQSFRYTNAKWECSGTIRDLYFWLSLLFIPALLHFAYTAVRLGNSGSMAMDLRMAALGKGQSGGNVYTPFYYILWEVTYLLYLIDTDKQHWRRTVTMGILMLAFATLTMSKALMFSWGIMTLYVLYRKKIISPIHILISLGVLLAVLLALHGVRQSMAMDDKHVSSVFEQYILRGFCAFDTLKAGSAQHWGENVFRIYYAVTYKLGLSSVEPVNPILPWVHQPVHTNTYSTLYPFFVDFGYMGVGLFGCLLGALTGWIYKKSLSGNVFYILVYTYITYMLVMQYTNESFFTNLAGHIKFIIVLAIPYIIGTHRLLVKKE